MSAWAAAIAAANENARANRVFTVQRPRFRPGSSCLIFLLETRDDREVFHRRRVSLDFGTVSHVLQDAAHDFSTARLRQTRREANVIRFRKGADFSADVSPQFFIQFIARFE